MPDAWAFDVKWGHGWFVEDLWLVDTACQWGRQPGFPARGLVRQWVSHSWLITKKGHSSLQGILFSFIGFLKFQAAFEGVGFISYAFTVFIQVTKRSLLTFTHHEEFQWSRGKQIDITGTANDIHMNININETKNVAFNFYPKTCR